MPVKQLVEYDPAITKIYLGIGAVIGNAKDKTKVILTSPVLSYDGEGCFETTNTLYIPKKAA